MAAKLYSRLRGISKAEAALLQSYLPSLNLKQLKATSERTKDELSASLKQLTATLERTKKLAEKLEHSGGSSARQQLQQHFSRLFPQEEASGFLQSFLQDELSASLKQLTATLERTKKLAEKLERSGESSARQQLQQHLSRLFPQNTTLTKPSIEWTPSQTEIGQNSTPVPASSPPVNEENSTGIQTPSQTVREQNSTRVPASSQPVNEENSTEIQTPSQTVLEDTTFPPEEATTLKPVCTKPEAEASDLLQSFLQDELSASLNQLTATLERSNRLVEQLERSGESSARQQLQQHLSRLFPQQNSTRVPASSQPVNEENSTEIQTPSQTVLEQITTIAPPEMWYYKALPEKTTFPPEEAKTQKPVCTKPEMTQVAAQLWLWNAVKNDDGLEVEQAFLCGADLDVVDELMTPLTLAARDCQEGALRALIRLGANLEKRDELRKLTPFTWAALYGRGNCVELLLSAGACAGMVKEEAQRKLWEGLRKNDVLLVERAVLCGANLEAKNSNGMTPLTKAVRDNQEEMVKTLIKLGANLEGRDGGWGKWTPLHHAAWLGHEHLAKILVEAGADLNATDSGGEIVLSLALRKKHTHLVSYLRSVGAILNYK